MNTLVVLRALLAAITADVVDNDKWAPHLYLPRERQGWHPPAYTLDNVTISRSGGDGTLGASALMRLRVVAVASETDTTDVTDELYRWADLSSTGWLHRLARLKRPEWLGLEVTGVQINDDLKIGPQSYRAALIGVDMRGAPST